MKLDPRIIKGKKPLTCFDSEYAKQFIGKTGFFTNKLEQFCDLDKLPKTELRKVWQNETYCFFTSLTMHKYFLPCEWVKQEEHWRPYTFEEFLARFQVGERIRYRKKDNPDYDIIEVLSVMRISQKHNEISVRLSCGDYDLQGLFDTFEIFDCESSSADFTPFGVKE